MKISILSGNTISEVDSNDIKSKEDLKKVIISTISESNTVTQTLKNTEALGQLLDATKKSREEERLKEIINLVTVFVSQYNLYRKFREKNSINTNTKYDSLSEDINKKRIYLEYDLACTYHKIKKENAHQFILKKYPSLKYFCKTLEHIYKYKE